MNAFIDTFYDITIKIDKESTATVDEIVSQIPPQIKNQLYSKYDYDTFNIKYNSEEPLYLAERTGASKQDLIDIMSALKSSIERSYSKFVVDPKLSMDGLRMSGNVYINNRRGPFKVTFKKGKPFNIIFIVIDSIISKSSEIRRKTEREDIQNILSSDDLVLIEENELLLARGLFIKETPAFKLLLKLKNIIRIADEIEGRFTNGDLSYNI